MERKFTTSTEKDFYEVIRSTSSYLKNLISSNSAQYQGKTVYLNTVFHIFLNDFIQIRKGVLFPVQETVFTNRSSLPAFQ